jgi:hypothetical protein
MFHFFKLRYLHNKCCELGFSSLGSALIELEQSVAIAFVYCRSKNYHRHEVRGVQGSFSHLLRWETSEY